MLVKTYGSACCGIDALTVTVEASVSPGFNFSLVGLPDSAVRESQERVGTALRSIGLKFPGRDIVVNMAPADLRKEGSAYDLPIAIAILAASGQINVPSLEKIMFMGELALDGALRQTKGALPIAIGARAAGFESCIFPLQSAYEAAVVEGINVYGFENLRQVVDFLEGAHHRAPICVQWSPKEEEFASSVCFSQVKGQVQAKRALEVAASGGHNVIMCGPPGAGKSFLAKCFASILPPLTLEESLQTTGIYSVAGLLPPQGGLMYNRPFRQPHHSCSVASFVGGGTQAMPGEMSLAHNGVLYLDEIAEFPRQTLELLRQPLEDKNIHLTRVKYRVTYPASFMLIASMNPCPCGYYGDPTHECICSQYQVSRYRNRISGPLLDRIDINLTIKPLTSGDMFSQTETEKSASIRSRVVKTRQIQAERFKRDKGIFTNSQIPAALISEFCAADKQALLLLKAAAEKLNYSARSHHRILRLARTIADMEQETLILERHIAEALQYR